MPSFLHSVRLCLDKRNASCEEDVDEFDDFEDGIYYLLSSVNESVLKKAGHQQQDFIVSCRFDGIRCRYVILNEVLCIHF